MITIPDNIFSQIMTCMGYPFIKEDELELDFGQIKEMLISAAMMEYYRWFPVEEVTTLSISGQFEVPFPDAFTFSAKDCRMTTNLMNYGPTGNALVDERFIQSSGGIYGRGMYGTRNSYGFDTARISRRVEMQSFIDKAKTFDWHVIENQRKITGFSNVAGTMKITWAKWSEDWQYVAFSQQKDVIKLCKAEILKYFGNLRKQDSVPDAPVELNGDILLEQASKLEEEVYEKWQNFTTPIITRG